jgi:CheY-like chemotaxis protein
VPQQSPISFQMGTKNVLIIDGNEAMQKLRARVLRSRGVHVHTAKSAAEAASLIQNLKETQKDADVSVSDAGHAIPVLCSTSFICRW